MLEKTVVIDNVKRFDGGLYRCSAVNAAGKNAKNITLNVTCKYPLPFIFKTHLCKIQGKADIEKELRSAPHPKLMAGGWLKSKY